MDEQFPGASQRGLVATFAEKGARRRNNIIYNSGAQLLVKFWWPGRRWEAFWVRALLSTSLETPGGHQVSNRIDLAGSGGHDADEKSDV